MKCSPINAIMSDKYWDKELGQLLVIIFFAKDTQMLKNVLNSLKALNSVTHSKKSNIYKKFHIFTLIRLTNNF